MTAKATTTPTSPRSETVEKMLAYAALHRLDPVPMRTELNSAYDHPLRGRGDIPLGADRVLLCPDDKPCPMCRARAALKEKVAKAQKNGN
jgi:hypothetical protein